MSWTNAPLRWFPLLLVAAVAMSCSSGDPEEKGLPPGVVEGAPTVIVTTPGPSPTSSVTTSDCPNESAIADDRARQVGPTSTADVDGDGVQDEVGLATDPAGPEGCATFVVVRIGGVTVTSAPVWEVGAEGGLPQPRIHGFTNIDGRPGAEVLIDEAAGASTQFVGAFVYIDEDLERITAKGGLAPEGGPFDDLFPYGGSVGHIEAVDCTADGIVVSTAVPSGGSAGGGSVVYEVERRLFTYDGAVLEEQETESEEVPIEDLDRFPEYSASPFGSC